MKQSGYLLRQSSPFYEESSSRISGLDCRLYIGELACMSWESCCTSTGSTFWIRTTICDSVGECSSLRGPSASLAPSPLLVEIFASQVGRGAICPNVCDSFSGYVEERNTWTFQIHYPSIFDFVTLLGPTFGSHWRL